MAEKKVSSAKTFEADKFYKIISKRTEKALTGIGGEEVAMIASAEGQEWKFEEVADGWLKIVSKDSGKVLDIILGGTENGAQIHQWDYTGADNQLWRVESAGRCVYKIVSKASGKCLDVVGMTDEDGARVQIWEDVAGENQTWKIQAVKAKPSAAKAPEAKKTAVEKKAPAKKSAAKKKASAKKSN